MKQETFDPIGILKTLKKNRWTRIFFNQRGEAGVDEGFESTAIPETYKDSAIGKYATVGDLAKGYGEAQKLIGAKGVIVPGENAKEEEVSKFYNSLGRPEKPEGYKFTPVEGLHPEIKITPESETMFRQMIHKHGLTAKQADGMYKDYFSGASGALTKRDQATSAAKHETEKALRTEWGAEYDNNLNKAKRLITKYGGADGADSFGELGNNPKVLKTLANIAMKFSEDGFIKGGGETNSEVKEAQQRLTDIMLNKDHPYWNTGAGHSEAVAEVKRLNQIIHPEVEV